MKNKGKNFGFTLIELLAVIIILAIISLISVPIIINVINESKISVEESRMAIFADKVRLKYSENKFNEIDFIVDDNFINELDNTVKCNFVYYDDEKNVILNKCSFNDSTKKYCMAMGKFYDCNNSEYIDIIDKLNHSYHDLSGANNPILLDNMIPIKYDGENWIYAYEFESWYNYNTKKWANAVVLNNEINKKPGDIINESEISLWYVWIPRYKYELFSNNNQKKINIIFENGIETTEEKDKTYTHPAFNFNDKNLTGFWISKFESTGTIDNMSIKANANILNSATIYQLYNSSKNLIKLYNINGNSHMIKNMEWGAISYFTYSQYGLCDNECKKLETNNTNITGSGDYKNNTNQSSTQNIYGIYDLNGGNSEYVMGNVSDNNNGFNYMNFIYEPDKYYYDKYNSNNNVNNFSLGKLGDATKEIILNNNMSWGGEQVFFPTTDNPWFIRNNIFNFNFENGDKGSYSTRSILVAEEVPYITNDKLPVEPIMLDNKYYTVENNKNKVEFESENWIENKYELNFSKKFGILIGEKNTVYKIKFKNNTGITFKNGSINTSITNNELGYLKQSTGNLSKNTVLPGENVEITVSVKNNFLTYGGNQQVSAVISYELDGKICFLYFIINYN